MASFNDNILKSLAQIPPVDAIKNVAGVTHVQAPAPPQSNAARIIGNEQCTRSAEADGLMHCNGDNIALGTLTGYIKDLREKNKGKVPPVITVSFEKGSYLINFPTDRIESLSKELENRGTDKNYPVVIGTHVDMIAVAPDKNSLSGVIVIAPDAVTDRQVSTGFVADKIGEYIEITKKQQRAAGVHKT